LLGDFYEYFHFNSFYYGVLGDLHCGYSYNGDIKTAITIVNVDLLYLWLPWSFILP